MNTFNSPNLSVVIITLNEGNNLSRCLKSVPKGAEIIVVDSGSYDNTEEIALSFGAQFSQHRFTDYGSQKNIALAKASRNWILSLDADEELSESFRENLVEFIAQDHQKSISPSFFCVPRRLVFLGQQLHFGKSSDHPIRLIYNPNFSRITFAGSIHEALDTQGQKASKVPFTGYLRHYSYESITDYFSKFNKYTDLVATKHKNAGKASPTAFAVSLRFFTEFFKRYVFLLGFLDGYRGYLYAVFSSVYGLVKYAKLKELSEHTGETHN